MSCFGSDISPLLDGAGEDPSAACFVLERWCGWWWMEGTMWLGPLSLLLLACLSACLFCLSVCRGAVGGGGGGGGGDQVCCGRVIMSH
jgi:hypothetical protein